MKGKGKESDNTITMAGRNLQTIDNLFNQWIHKTDYFPLVQHLKTFYDLIILVFKLSCDLMVISTD